MKRIRKMGLWFLLLLIPVCAITGFLATEKGMQWTYQKLIAARIAPLELNGLQGHWWGPIQIEDLRYNDPDLQIAAHKVTLDFHILALLRNELDITSFESNSLVITKNQTRPDASRDTFMLPELPIGIRLRSGIVHDITIHPAQEPAIQIDQLRLTARTRKQDIKIESLVASARNFDLLVKGKLQLTDLLPASLVAQWKYRGRGMEYSGSASAEGNRMALHVQLHQDQPLGAKADITLRDWTDSLHWDAQLQTQTIEPSILGMLGITGIGSVDSIHAQASGDLQQASGQIRIAATHTGLGTYQVQSDLHTDLHKLTWQELELSVPASQMLLHSRGVMSWDQELQIDATGTWKNIAYPIKPPARMISPEGSFQLKGPGKRLELSSSFTASAPNFPANQARLKLVFDQDASIVLLEKATIETLDGEAILSGSMDLAKSMSWILKFDAKNLNPGQQWPDWEGNINLSGTAQGMAANAQGQVRIETLSGKLQGKTLAGNADLRWSQDGISKADIRLHSGSAMISANGSLATALDFDWQIQAPRMQDLLPHARGSLMASGKISGSPDRPAWKMDVRADRLKLDELSIGALSANLNLPADTENGSLIVSARETQWYGQNWQTIEIKGSGALNKHPLHLHAAAEQRFLDVQLTGAWLDRSWNADIKALSWHRQELGTWSLADPTSLKVSLSGVQVDPACLSGTNGKLCFDFAFNGTENNQGHIQINNVPLNLIAGWMPTHIEAEGELQGQLDWIIRGKRWQSLQATLKASPGKLSLPTITGETASLFWPHEGGTLDASLRKETLSLAWNIRQSAQNTITGELQVSAQDILNANYSSPIRGSLQASIDDLRIFEVLVPQVYRLQGHGFADLKISGTLEHPRFDGQIGLKKTQFEWPRLGLQIQDLDLNIRPRAANTYAIVASARSDKGMLYGDGEFSWPAWNQYRGEIKIKGEEFQAANLPEAELWISPDLVLTITPGRVEMNGRMLVPRARIHPKEIPQSVAPTDDVVIRGREASTTEQRWKFDSRIQLALGKDIRFDGFGLKGMIRGNLDIIDRPDTLTLAQGELRIEEGTYKAYGQDLKIDTGKLIFINSEITNPGLDIQASRKINEITAGVRVVGTAENPELQLYSQPGLSQADILSYLTLGRPMQQLNASEGANLANTAATSAGLAGGEFLASWISQQMGISEKVEVSTETNAQQPWVRVGAYLSPRLYISYGVNLFENGSSLKVRYLLTPKWTLQGESGTQTGGDILYTIER